MRLLATWFGLGWLLICSPVFADGLFFRPNFPLNVPVGQSEQIVASPRQEALLVRTDGQVQVTLRTYFRAGPRDLAWVIPVPHAPTKVEKADDAVFRDLDECSRPRFFQIVNHGAPSGGMGCGCGGAGGPMSSESVPAGSIRIEGAGAAGIFDYTVLSADNTGVLLRWLADRNYAVPDTAEPVLRQYVDARWHWLAIRLRPEDARAPVLAPHPIRYTYDTSWYEGRQITFPLVISRPAADAESEIVLYVLDAQRCRFMCRNWVNVEIGAGLKLDSSAPSGTNYEALFREAVQGHAFVTEFAAELREPMRAGNLNSAALRTTMGDRAGPMYLTRLRTVISPDRMDRDVVLVPADNTSDVSGSHEVASNSRRDDRGDMICTALIFGLPLAGCWLLRRKGSHGFFAETSAARTPTTG
jgi:hypothetical protein